MFAMWAKLEKRVAWLFFCFRLLLMRARASLWRKRISRFAFRHFQSNDPSFVYFTAHDDENA